MPFTGPTYAIPAGTLNPAVVGTPVSADDWNAFVTDLEAALSDTLRASNQTFAGQVFFDDTASAATPAIAFTADTDSGIFQKGANEVGVAVGGTEVLLAKAAGVDVTGALAVSGASAIAGNETVGGTLEVTGVVTALAGIACNAQKITGVLDPTADQEAATKKYVDDVIGSATTAWSQPTAGANCVTTLLRTRKVNGQVQFNGSISFTGAINPGDIIATTGFAPWSVVGANYGSAYISALVYDTNGSAYTHTPILFTVAGGQLNIIIPASSPSATCTLYLDGIVYYGG
jgi:hypothetical protein